MHPHSSVDHLVRDKLSEVSNMNAWEDGSMDGFFVLCKGDKHSERIRKNKNKVVIMKESRMIEERAQRKGRCRQSVHRNIEYIRTLREKTHTQSSEHQNIRTMKENKTSTRVQGRK